MPSSTEEVVAALRGVEALAGLTDADYVWLAENGIERRFAPGATLFREGDPADSMKIMLAGEVHIRRAKSANASFVITQMGQIFGLVPFSRMKGYGGTAHSIGEVWVLDVPQEKFSAMLAAIPTMAQHCVSVLLTRVRELTRIELQQEKLTALGKLAANLAHELNNPASAAQRTASSFYTELKEYGRHQHALGTACLSEEESARYEAWFDRTRISTSGASEPNAMTAADHEEALLNWLETHNVAEAWQLAPTLAESAVSVAQLDNLASFTRPDLLHLALANFTSSVRMERMADTVVHSTGRIFDLIRAIKDYSYMDIAPIQEVDLARTLDTTLSMMTARLSGVTIERSYDPEVPPVSAYGSELNQVWTELIDNALDAMHEQGTLGLATRRQGEMVIVEISDTGGGVPEELKAHIFEPFFTTKPPGSGLGLGLDSVNRIVAKHAGIITLESRPGATLFRVRLPINQAKAY